VEKEEKIPSSKIHRSSIVGKTLCSVGAKKLGHLAKKPFAYSA